MIKGLALLSFCFLAGMSCGALLGTWLGIDANVGGVGFAMAFLLLSKEHATSKGWWSGEFAFGLDFWNKLYIPIVIAMAASLNVKSALTSGILALLAGTLPVFFAFGVVKVLLKQVNTEK